MKKYLIYSLLFIHVFITGNFGVFMGEKNIPTVKAASTTISYAGTAIDLSDSTMGWSNIGDVTGNTTGTSASSILVDRRIDGNTLALTNFNLAAAGLPIGATINGIQADVEWQGSNTRVRDTVIRLTKDGTTKVGNDYATDANGTGTKTITTYGGVTDLWGTTWTASELLSTNFGIHLQYLNRQATDRTVDIFRVGITIDYTVATNIAPTDIILSGSTIDEGLPTGTTIGTLSSSDLNIGDTHTYAFTCTIAGTDDASFAISGVNLNSNAIYNFATKSTYNICIRTTDSGSLTFDKNFVVTINNPNPPELDFETAGGYTVTSGTWFRQSTTVFEGSFALEADNGGVANSSSCFERSQTITTDSIVSFYYKVSSEATYDFLRFYIDGVEQNSWSGDIDWTQQNITGVTAGTYTYRWCYTKDGSVDSLNDTAYIDLFDVVEDTSTTVGVLDFEVAGGYTVTGGTWTRQTTTVQEGVFAIEADNGGLANSSSCFTRDETITNPTDQVSFWYKVSSEANYDFLRFSVDGTEITTWSGEAGWSQYLHSPGVGTHTLQWCYTKDGSVDGGSDTAWVDDVGITTFTPPTDTTPPIISSPSFSSGALLPGGNHNLVINYTDSGSTIDTATADIILNKWDGVSTWGPDISGSGINTISVGTSSANYTTNNLDFGKYRYIFSIDDSSGNTGSGERVFYIDEPEFIVGSGSIDMGYVDSIGADFSDTVPLIVRTVGAPFNLTFTNTTAPIYIPETIPSWNGTRGFGYQQSPFSGTLSTINTDEIVASEALFINTNGNKNTYTYDIQIGALVDISQAAGEYIGDLKFDIDFQY